MMQRSIRKSEVFKVIQQGIRKIDPRTKARVITVKNKNSDLFGLTVVMKKKTVVTCYKAA
jgi:ribonuclease P protein component